MRHDAFTGANRRPTVAFGLCGSFCTLEQVLPVIRTLMDRGWEVLPIMSRAAAETDTRFGTAQSWRRALQELTGHPVMTSLTEVEPLGPKDMADAMIVAPCTGSTLARLDMGLSTTPVTLAAKSLLRGHKPIVLAVSTNDGLGASAQHIGALLARRDYYFVPFGQDDCRQKPMSLKAKLEKIPDTLVCALGGSQIQPVLLGEPLFSSGIS